MARTRQTARRHLVRDRRRDVSTDSSYVDANPDESLIMKKEVKHLESRYDADNYIQLYEAGSAPPNKQKADKYREYIICSTRFFNREGRPTGRNIEIKSALLKKALKDVIGEYPGISFHTVTITLNVPFHVLWHHSEELKTLQDEQTEEESELRDHLKILNDYLDNEFHDVNKEYQNLVSEGLISSSILWTLFKPNQLIYTSLHGQPRVLKLDTYSEGCDMGGPYASLACSFVDYDGTRFGFNNTNLRIPMFDGTMKIADLPALPFDFHPKKDEITQRLIQRGKKYVSLQGINCREYNGIAIDIMGCRLSRVHVNGRIMVDADTHALFEPDMAKSLKPLRTKSKNKTETEMDVDEDDDGYDSYPEDNYGNETTGQDFDDNEKKVKKVFALTEDQYLLCNALVWGYALDQKKWLQFFVDKVQPVQWNPVAFDKLVLPDAQKDLVRALVEAHTNPDAPSSFDDFIANKGKGLIAVLHGPPGCGKTFTCESVAEFANRPLYTVSSGDLGVTPIELEKSLNDILKLCSRWKAVLLLDEADVYLEERSLHDINRNSLVSIFLRLLEYYRGILFLTTNRVKTFDEAFQSRIHIALRYQNLDEGARAQVWRNFVNKIDNTPGAKKSAIVEEDYDYLAQLDLNGRQIKNAARTGLSLAENKGEVLSIKHLKTVLGVVEAFEKDFKEGKQRKEA